MSKLQKEEKELKEAEEATARPPPSAPSPATSATLSDSTKSKEGSATYDKSESAELAKKGSYSLEKCTDMCATPPVKQQRHDEAPNSAPKKTTSHQSLKESAKESSAVRVEEAWERLKKSFVYYRGKPVAILAATDPMAEALNYNQVSVRDFVPSGLACLMKDPVVPEIVKNSLLKTLHLQGREKMVGNFTLGEGVLPATSKVSYDSLSAQDTVRLCRTGGAGRIGDEGGHNELDESEGDWSEGEEEEVEGEEQEEDIADVEGGHGRVVPVRWLIRNGDVYDALIIAHVRPDDYADAFQFYQMILQIMEENIDENEIVHYKIVCWNDDTEDRGNEGDGLTKLLCPYTENDDYALFSLLLDCVDFIRMPYEPYYTIPRADQLLRIFRVQGNIADAEEIGDCYNEILADLYPSRTALHLDVLDAIHSCWVLNSPNPLPLGYRVFYVTDLPNGDGDGDGDGDEDVDVGEDGYVHGDEDWRELGLNIPFQLFLQILIRVYVFDDGDGANIPLFQVGGL